MDNEIKKNPMANMVEPMDNLTEKDSNTVGGGQIDASENNVSESSVPSLQTSQSDTETPNANIGIESGEEEMTLSAPQVDAQEAERKRRLEASIGRAKKYFGEEGIGTINDGYIYSTNGKKRLSIGQDGKEQGERMRYGKWDTEQVSTPYTRGEEDMKGENGEDTWTMMSRMQREALRKGGVHGMYKHNNIRGFKDVDGSFRPYENSDGTKNMPGGKVLLRNGQSVSVREYNTKWKYEGKTENEIRWEQKADESLKNIEDALSEQYKRGQTFSLDNWWTILSNRDVNILALNKKFGIKSPFLTKELCRRMSDWYDNNVSVNAEAVEELNQDLEMQKEQKLADLHSKEIDVDGDKISGEEIDKFRKEFMSLTSKYGIDPKSWNASKLAAYQKQVNELFGRYSWIPEDFKLREDMIAGEETTTDPEKALLWIMDNDPRLQGVAEALEEVGFGGGYNPDLAEELGDKDTASFDAKFEQMRAMRDKRLAGLGELIWNIGDSIAASKGATVQDRRQGIKERHQTIEGRYQQALKDYHAAQDKLRKELLEANDKKLEHAKWNKEFAQKDEHFNKTLAQKDEHFAQQLAFNEQELTKKIAIENAKLAEMKRHNASSEEIKRQENEIQKAYYAQKQIKDISKLTKGEDNDISKQLKKMTKDLADPDMQRKMEIAIDNGLVGTLVDFENLKLTSQDAAAFEIFSKLRDGLSDTDWELSGDKQELIYDNTNRYKAKAPLENVGYTKEERTKMPKVL